MAAYKAEEGDDLGNPGDLPFSQFETDRTGPFLL